MMKRLDPPGLWSVVLAICSMLWILDDVSCQVSPQPFTFLGMPIIGVVLAVNYVFHLIPRKPTPNRQQEKPSKRMWRWLVFPTAALIIISALYHPWPMTLRFSLSRQAFEDRLRQIQSGAKVDTGSQMIGLYRVRWITTELDKNVCFITGHSIIDPVGFCYDPTTQPASSPYHRRIVDSWYATEF
jgi:hypothetical protein